MTPDQFTSLIGDWGWLGVFLWILVTDILPWVRDKWFPAAVEERKRKELVKQKLEERQTIAWERLGDTMQGIREAIVQNNERLGNLVSSFAAHDKSMNEAVTVMRERTRPLDQAKDRGKARISPTD